MSWISAITGRMDKDQPDTILNAIRLTVLNGVLCDPYDGSCCSDCRKIWDAVEYRMKRDG